MTFSDALDSVVRRSSHDAIKRPAMGGYLFRSAVSEECGTEGDYTLTFRERNDANGAPRRLRVSERRKRRHVDGAGFHARALRSAFRRAHLGRLDDRAVVRLRACARVGSDDRW